ncbi:MAG TPA: ABC transporter substrate-binding protein/permease [Atopostipes sp.]|nr:ABC transporter substrate-binding protein/permease [Atopostipes sp.]
MKNINWTRWLKISILAVILTLMPFTSVASAQEDSYDLETINQGLEEEGVLKVGMEANYAPFNWSQTSASNDAVEISNSPGEYANGYDVQMAVRLAEELGLTLEIIKLEWDGLPPALESGMIDAVIAGMSPTPERARQIDFSDAYYDSDIVLVVKNDSDLADATTLDAFDGTRVTAQLNTFHYDLIEQIPNVQQQTAMDSFPSMISSVLSDKSDAYVSERPGAMAATAANSNLTYIVFDENQGFDTGQVDTSIAVGMRRNSPIVDSVNRALATISQDERDTLMNDMVLLNERGESAGFWSDVAEIWDMYGSQFLVGARNTLIIALISTVLGSLIGLGIAIYRSIPVDKKRKPVSYVFYKLFDLVIIAYIEIFRGTPMMVQSMLIFYGSKLFFDIDMSPMFAALLIVSVNTGAYLSEVFRGGIMGVDKGQGEAAKAIGMSHYQSMTTVILPQAIRNTLPALGNEFVINIKDTSVLNVIAVTELFFVTRSAAGSTYMTFQSFLIASVIYFVMTFVTTRLLRLIEKYMSGSTSYRVHESSTMPANVERGMR